MVSNAFGGLNLGAYDLAQTLTSNPLTYSHIFIDQTNDQGWATTTYQQTAYQFAETARSLGRIPLITIEPFVGGDVLTNVASGNTDEQLGVIASDLKRYGGPAIIRWGQECENSAHPWGNQPPANYIAAYRHVVAYLRAACPGQQLYFMWSPMGNSNCPPYYPGADVVDYVGCSLYEMSSYQYTVGNFPQLFGPKYSVLSQFNKPMIVAECGVWANDDQDTWISEMKARASSYPLLQGVVYFNAQDSATWPNGIVPDWRLKNPSIWVPTPTPSSVSIKDFNSDGYGDLVWEDTITGQRAIWFLKNGVVTSITFLPTVPVE